MSFTLKKSYQFFRISKLLIIFAQLIATFYLILWNMDFWEKIIPQVEKIFEFPEFQSIIKQIFYLVIPCLISIALYFFCLFILYILKQIILHIPCNPTNIVSYEKKGEIKPLFARRIAEHYKWNAVLNLEQFYNFFEQTLNQEKNLKKHQENKSFYDFLCKYDDNLSSDFPYDNPRTAIVRREELVKVEKTKIEPFILDDNE